MTGGEKLAWGLRVGELSVGMAAALPARWELFFLLRAAIDGRRRGK
jgi:hypothetical protein